MTAIETTERPYGQWKELFHEVVSTNLCTGCAACIMACPRDVLSYDDATYHPFNVEDTTPFDDCMHGERGCDICTKACPRFRVWEVECDKALFGRPRRDDEPFGMYKDVLLVRAASDEIFGVGQDGGLVSALLIWGLEMGRIEGALVSKLSEKRAWDAEPALATTREEVLASAGSRYTYAANPLAMKEAEARGLKLALVGMSCQSSINGTLTARNVAKYRRKIELTIGLLCSKSFTYDGLMAGKVEKEMGIPLSDVAKVNVKGAFQIWRRSTGEKIEIPLKECHQFTREGCKLCPDFAAEHADISTGGLGQNDGWTLTIVRTERGAEWMHGLEEAGWIHTRPGSADPAAIELLRKLATKQRRRLTVTVSPAGGDAGVAVP